MNRIALFTATALSALSVASASFAALTETAPVVWSGPSLTQTGLFENETLTGTSTAAANSYLTGNGVSITDTLNAGHSSNRFDAWQVYDLIQTGTIGGRNAIHPEVNVFNVPGDTGNNGTNLPAYVADFPVAIGSVNMGGTGTTFIAAAGSLYGVNPEAIADSGATDLYGINAGEFDVVAFTGSSMAEKYGITIIEGSGDAVHGSGYFQPVVGVRVELRPLRWKQRGLLADDVDGHDHQGFRRPDCKPHGRERN